jgi:hypothetical protein
MHQRNVAAAFHSYIGGAAILVDAKLTGSRNAIACLIAAYNRNTTAWLSIAKLIADPTRATTKGIFIISSWGLGWFVAERSAAGFSQVASNILVAGAGGTPLAERSCATPQMDAPTYSASMRDFHL